VIRRILKSTLLLISAYLVLACDESGRFNTEPIGVWELIGDSTINSFGTYYSPPSDWGAVSETLTIDVGGSWFRETVYTDTTTEYEGTWSIFNNTLTLKYNGGSSLVRTFAIQGEYMNLTFTRTTSAVLTRFVSVYLRLE